MKQIVSLIFSLIACNSNPIYCNDQCLLSKLGFYFDPKTSITNGKKELVLNGYDILNDEFVDNALIWIQPYSYFSGSFMKQITNSNSPTNDNFRDAIYQKYIASHNLSLTLKIYKTQHQNQSNNILTDNVHKQQTINIAQSPYIQQLLNQYHFDSIQYQYKHKYSIENLNEHPNQKNNRVLLQNYYQGDDEPLEFDILNQHTYDEYDWFLYAFSIFTFGCLCMCCGWCSHKKYISDKMIDDDDVESLATPISASGNDHKKNKYSFEGFNIFGEQMHGDGSRNTTSHDIENPMYDIDPMQYTEVLSKTKTPTLMPVKGPRLTTTTTAESQVSDIELAEKSTPRHHQYANSNTLSPEHTPRDATRHSRKITPLTIISPIMSPKNNRLSAQRQQLEILAHAKQLHLQDAHDDNTPGYSTEASNGSVAKFGHDYSNTMTFLGTPVTHDGGRVWMAPTPSASHASARPSALLGNFNLDDPVTHGTATGPGDLIVYEDENGNIVAVAGANGEIVSTQPGPTADALPQLYANQHSPNFLNLRPPSPQNHTATMQRSKSERVYTRDRNDGDDGDDVGTSVQRSKSERSSSIRGAIEKALSVRSSSLRSSPIRSSSLRNKNAPPPISIGDNVDEKKDNDTTLITLMKNPDQAQKKLVPHILMPAKESAIVPKYKTDLALAVSPQTTDIIASPDSDDPSQTHLSLDILVGGTSNSVDRTMGGGAYGKVILPFHADDSLKTPQIDELAELDDDDYENINPFKPAPPPGTPPTQASRNLTHFNQNPTNIPRAPPGPPPRQSSPPPPVPQQASLGLEVIVEGPEDEEVMSPESKESLRKTYEDAIASDIITNK